MHDVIEEREVRRLDTMALDLLAAAVGAGVPHDHDHEEQPREVCC